MRGTWKTDLIRNRRGTPVSERESPQMPAVIVEGLVDSLFRGLFEIDAHQYLERWPFHSNWSASLPEGISLHSKQAKSDTSAVDPRHREPYPPEFDDLIRLHWLCLSRNVLTVLEVGAGYSTYVFDDAMKVNRARFPKLDGRFLRKSNLFEVHSLDASSEWIETTRSRAVTDTVTFHQSPVKVSQFNGRICTFFDKFPQVSADLIYLDGPDQFNVEGNVRNVTTAHPDRMPMSADLLAIEHFIAPGTLIVVDGRTANARFLATNFQRDWVYEYSPDFDQSFFELREGPLGRFNKRLLEFQSETTDL